MLRNDAIPLCEKFAAEGIKPIPVFLLDAPAYPLLPLQMKAKIQNKNSSTKNCLMHISQV